MRGSFARPQRLQSCHDLEWSAHQPRLKGFNCGAVYTCVLAAAITAVFFPKPATSEVIRQLLYEAATKAWVVLWALLSRHWWALQGGTKWGLPDGRPDRGIVLQTKLGGDRFWGLWCMHVLMRPSHTEINLQSSMSQSIPTAMLVTCEMTVFAVI